MATKHPKPEALTFADLTAKADAGDVDNYAKVILDGIKGVVFVGDDQAQVRRLFVERVLTPAKADARTVVIVRGEG